MIGRVVQGGETLFFKEKFSIWADNTPMSGGAKKSLFGLRKKKEKAPESVDVTKLHNIVKYEEAMVDEGQVCCSERR